MSQKEKKRVLTNEDLKRLPLLLRRGGLFFILLILLVRCSTAEGIRASSLTVIPGNRIIASAEDETVLNEIRYDNSGRVEQKTKKIFSLAQGRIESLLTLGDGSLAVITEENGVFIFPEKSGMFSGEPVHLSAEPEGKQLADYRIRDVYLYEYGRERKLYIVYKSPFGSGVSECVISRNWDIGEIKTLTKNNSQLRSNYVHQVISDLRGNIWFRYSPDEAEGVSRLQPSGDWDHYDRNNSELGNSSVALMVIEERRRGLKGDNIWFVSDAGLSRLDYGGRKDVWKLYGEKQTFVNKFLRLLGLESYFSDAILGILDIAVLEDSIMIANKYAMFHFTGDNINRFIPETVKDLDNSQVSHILYRNGFFFVLTKLPLKHDPTIRSVMILDLKERKWVQLKYWDLMKEYPDNIHFVPLKNGRELMVLKYRMGAVKFAVIDYKDFTPEEIVPGR